MNIATPFVQNGTYRSGNLTLFVISLSWVKEEQLDAEEVQYRIWIDPQTGKPAESCPFLAQKPGKATSYCTIQAVKPLVCWEYPFTKKHAQHTGCRGFEVNERN